MAETTERILDGQSEQAKVESWRLHVLMEAGYPLPLAEKLAASEADLHTARRARRQGCDPTDGRRDPALGAVPDGQRRAAYAPSTLAG